MALTIDQLRNLARHGAQARIRELHAEIEAISREFGLGWRGGDKRAPQARPGRPRKRKLSAAARKAISDAQKKRWAAQREDSEANSEKIKRRAGKKR